MGAGAAGGYVTIVLRTQLNRYEPKTDQLRRISELIFAGASVPDDPAHQPPPDIDKIDPGPAPGSPPAGKLGLGGLRPGDDVAFKLFARMDDGSLMGMGLAPYRKITGELEHAFAGRWAGFAVALAPTGGRFRLVADITLRPRWKKGAQKPLQVVPVVMAFGTDRFIDHYLLAVITAQSTPEKIDTAVTQSYQ